MSFLDFSDFAPEKRKPTKKEVGRYKRWRKYLRYSKLTPKEQHLRAVEFTEQGRDPQT